MRKAARLPFRKESETEKKRKTRIRAMNGPRRASQLRGLVSDERLMRSGDPDTGGSENREIEEKSYSTSIEVSGAEGNSSGDDCPSEGSISEVNHRVMASVPGG